MKIEFHHGKLTASEQEVVAEGFRAHSEELDAPEYIKERVKWLGFDERNEIRSVLLAEEFAVSRELSGIWLWTQSWQAEGFYRQLGYAEFTRFDDFPKGHSRIGFRKQLVSSTD